MTPEESEARLKKLARAASKWEYEGFEYMLMDTSPEGYGFEEGSTEHAVWQSAKQAAWTLGEMLSEGTEYVEGLTEEQYEALMDEWASE